MTLLPRAVHITIKHFSASLTFVSEPGREYKLSFVCSFSPQTNLSGYQIRLHLVVLSTDYLLVGFLCECFYCQCRSTSYVQVLVVEVNRIQPPQLLLR